MDKVRLLSGQIALVQKRKDAFAFKRDECNVKVVRLKAVLSQRDAYNQVPKRLKNEMVRSEARSVAALNKAEDELKPFLRDSVLLMTDLAGQHFARVRVSVIELSSTVVEMFPSAEKELEDIVPNHSVLEDSPLNISRAILSPDVLLLLWIDT